MSDLSVALSRLSALQASLGELAGYEWTEAAAVEELRAAAAQCEALTGSAAALRHGQQRQWARRLTTQSPTGAETAANAAGESRSSMSTTGEPAKTSSAADAPLQADVELQRREAVKAMEDGGVLTMYMQSGKKKHDRYFWLENGNTICWDKKRTKPGKSNKAGVLMSFEPEPATKTAREWFDFFDDDHSGELDAEELAQLYRSARGEKLKKKELKAAMDAMDKDGDGTIDFEEFESWWRANGGDLESKRHLAMTIVVEGDVQLLLVAKDMAQKQSWLAGFEAVLGNGPCR